MKGKNRGMKGGKMGQTGGGKGRGGREGGEKLEKEGGSSNSLHGRNLFSELLFLLNSLPNSFIY